MIRSPFFYVGDKFKLLKQMLQYFPDNINCFIEPFCGGGSVFLNTSASRYVVNDNNKSLINLHKFLQSHKFRKEEFVNELLNIIEEYKLSLSLKGNTVPEEIKNQYKKTYYAHYNKESYLKMRNDFNKDKVNYYILYLLIVYGFNHMLRFNKKGNFNLPVGNVDFNKNVLSSIKGYFDFVEKSNIEFNNLDFEEFILKTNISTDDFIYLDPPYLITSSEYNKYWNEDEEIRLLNLLDRLNEKGIRFALSNVLEHKGRRNNILESWITKYNVYYLKSNYISFNDNSLKNTVEILVTNY